MPIQTQNPTTGEILETFDAYSDAQVDTMLDKSAAAFQALKDTNFKTRGKWMKKAADILEDEVDDLAELATLEMGKTLAAAKAEVEKCAWVCRYYADTAEAHMADEIVETDASKSYRRYLPMGPVLAVMPWNYPFWQVFRFAAPALMAGNTGLLKHASNVPQVALAIQDIFERAGFPDGAFQTLLISGGKVERVLRNKIVTAATLTGSEPAGASVASICGDEIKPTLLELGGSDPFIVMPSADLDKAVEVGTTARTQNNGQSCIAAKRFIVHADVYESFKEKLRARFESLKVGDPMKDDTDIGPLVNKDSLMEITGQVDQAIKDGAARVCGAQALDGEGVFFTPGILEDIPKDSPAYSEEIFGPVALLFKVETFEKAIELANDTSFGLGSAIFTQDEDEQMEAINRLEAGATFVNSMTSSDPRLPFGGIKRSGYGRELAAEGIRTFCNVKTISIA